MKWIRQIAWPWRNIISTCYTLIFSAGSFVRPATPASVELQAGNNFPQQLHVTFRSGHRFLEATENGFLAHVALAAEELAMQSHAFIQGSDCNPECAFMHLPVCFSLGLG